MKNINKKKTNDMIYKNCDALYWIFFKIKLNTKQF